MATMTDFGRDMARPRRRSVIGGAVVGLVVIVLVAVGVLVSVLLLPERAPSSLQGGGVSVSSVGVSSVTFDGARQVAVSLRTDQGLALRSGVSGVVTSSGCQVGGVLASGQSLLAVDGQPVIGLATSQPLWRDLSGGVQGADVASLQTELARLGYQVQVSGVYDAVTVTAVKGLVKAAGGVSADGSLLLSQMVWFPSPQVTVSACPASVGSVVSAGDSLGQAGGGLTSLTVTNPPGDGWVVVYDGLSAVMDSNGVVTDPVFLAGVEAGPEYQYFTANPGSGSLQLTVQLATSLTVLVVPPSSVIVAGVGTGCVVSGGQTVPVKIVSSSLGQTMVQVMSGLSVSSVEVQPDPDTLCS
ncbi:MAG: peptidoglycan-binding protein [Propionibacteriaceae bacterium]|nr:peptidoglycan-binding protein [Propionibacteriaceae bacterium]